MVLRIEIKLVASLINALVHFLMSNSL